MKIVYPEFEQLFYDPNIGTESSCLSSEESRHCIRVLRHQANDSIYIVDGMGTLYRCKIIEPNEKKCAYEITDTIPHWKQRNYRIQIGISPTKNIARFEWFVEKATELGVDEIIPLISHYTLITRVNHTRLEKIAISAMKQSKQAKLPIIKSLTDFYQFINKPHLSECRIIAHQGENSQPINKWYKSGNDVIVLLGPEGGFSPQEIQLTKSLGFNQISLGQNRLRTETAGITLMAIIQSMNFDDL